MRLLVRYLWQAIPVTQRELLLAQLKTPNRQASNRILRAKTSYPDTFDKHKIIYIHVPKSAGKSVSLALGLDKEKMGHLPACFYQSIDPEKYKNYYKFGFVRNPWDRFASAFYFLRGGGTKNRDEDWGETIRNYEDINNFVSKWLNYENAHRQTHFTPMFRFFENSHGVIDTNYIGRFESLQNDYNHLRRSLAFGTELPHINASNHPDYKNIYTKASIDKIARIYEDDIEKFGYDFY